MKRSPVRMAMLGLGALGVAYLVTAYLMNAMASKRNRYLIPEGYVGWLCVTYKAPDAPVLKLEDGFRLLRFSGNGSIRTSTEAMPGKHWDEFYYYAGDERRRIDPRKHIGGGYSSAPDAATGGYTFRFWVSGDPKKDAALFSKSEGDTCGPVAGATASTK